MEFPNDVLDFVLDNLRKLFFPEEWITMDLSISKTEMFSMLLIDRRRELTMTQIADIINVPMSTATGIIERLVRKGYLKRERSDSDRRIVVIRLTAQGKTLIAEFKKQIMQYLQIVESLLTEEEKHTLFSIFTKVFDKLNAQDSQSTSVQGKTEKTIKKINIE